ncbi:MAG: isoleucine--tRNA ligase, partial [Candidatus Aeolococcus gillhamiae]
ESGSMPFAQVHYPFENSDWFEDHYPGDFIVEYIAQTRAWFYTLHVMATALFDRPAFKTCLTHGVVLGSDGQKMSKRLRNYPDPEEMFAKHGSDAMRWYLMSSPILRGGDSIVDEKGIPAAVRSALLPLWNAWYFFSLYANADARWASLGRVDSPAVLDRYVLAKLRSVVGAVTEAMDSYDISGACAAVEGFLDALNNWYIRRSRDRFWGTTEDEADTQRAFDTLATVIEVLCRVAAPLLPLETEVVWRGITAAESESVHLADWPQAESLPADPDLVAGMDRVREVCSAAHSVRKAASLRARLPLAALTIAAPDSESLAPFAGLVADELNVKQVRFTNDVDSYAERHLIVNFKVAAPRLGGATPEVAAAARNGDWALLRNGRARVGESELEAGEFEMRLDPVAPETTRALSDGVLVILDTDLTPELLAEGTARDVVRVVQQYRRDHGFDVSDRIHLRIAAPQRVRGALTTHRAWLGEQTLAVSVELLEPEAPALRGEEWTVSSLPDGEEVAVAAVRQ